MDQDTTATGDGGPATRPAECPDESVAAQEESSHKKRPRPTTPPGQTNDENGAEDAVVSNNNEKTKQPNNNHSSHPKNPKKRKHMDPIILQLRTDLHQCCRNNDLVTAWQLFTTARQQNVRIETHVLYNLLSLCDGLGARPLHVGTPRRPAAAATTTTITATAAAQKKNGAIEEGHDGMAEDKEDETPRQAATPSFTAGEDEKEPSVDNKNNDPAHNDSGRIQRTTAVVAVSDTVRCEYARQILSYVRDDRQLVLTETAYTALTRLFVRTGDLRTAEQFLTQAEHTPQCKVKLRLYSPILLAYCDRRDWYAALRLWARACREQKISLTEREYAALLPAPYFSRVLADLMEDVTVPSKQTVQVLRQCLLVSSSGDDGAAMMMMTDEMQDLLAQIPAPELQTTLILPPADHGWIESTNCTIDRFNGVLLSGCLQGVTLPAVTLPNEYVQAMLSMNERIVLTGRIDADATPFQGGGKGKKRELTARDLQQRQRHWHRFREYMATVQTTTTVSAAATTTTTNERRSIAVVIDGANVGYHEQNYKGCPKHVNYEQIDAVVRQFDPRTVLLVLHTRHCTPPLMPAFAQRYMEQWSSFLYQTPPGMNDDWFWLHAALETNAMVVTNDHMRDHHFQMVTPRSFLRWRDRHQIYFHFVFGGGGGNLRVQLTYPDPYSRRIHLVDDGLIVPMPKRGDESRFLDGCFVAEDAPEEERYVCFRPRKPEDV